MKKDAYYFPHDCNARNDPKLIAVRSNYGIRGYGIYFGIIEILREAKGYQISSKYNLLAYDLREDEKDIKNIIENYDLFIIEGGLFWSESLLQRMGKLSEVRENRRLAGREGGLAKARNLLQQNPSKNLPLKESKVKQSIYVHDAASQLHFEYLWMVYPKRVGKKEALRHFNASVKTEKDLSDIKLGLNNYMQSDTVKKGFIQNGSTWFNNWRDWVEAPEASSVQTDGSEERHYR